jgi:hypothetical protein
LGLEIAHDLIERSFLTRATAIGVDHKRLLGQGTVSDCQNGSSHSEAAKPAQGPSKYFGFKSHIFLRLS